MNTNNDPIHKAFAQLKEMDEARAPSLDRVLRRARAKKDVAFFEFFPWGRLVAGLALLTALLYFGSPFKKSPVEVVDETATWAAISSWSASTDGLIADSSQSISSATATNTDSWIQDGDTSSTQNQSL
jgi:hypothetical protein